MKRTHIPVLRPQLPTAELLLPYIEQIDAHRLYSNHGPLNSELEQSLIQRLGLHDGGLVTASSGTAALVGAMMAAAGRATPEKPLAVIPAYTFVATALAAEQCGYQPHLADVKEQDWTLDPDQLLASPALSRFGLVVPVACYGRSLDVAAWCRFRDRTGIPVVIDAAGAFDIAIEAPHKFNSGLPVALSFHATKSFSTGEGGAVFSSDTLLIQLAAQALNFGFYGDRNCRMASINGKLSEYHAAIGLAELAGWEEKQARLVRTAARYRSLLKGCGLADRFVGAPEVSGMYALFDCHDEAEAGRLCKQLEVSDIGYRRWYGLGLHRETYFEHASGEPLPVTSRLAPRLIGLPMAPDLPESDQLRVVEAVAEAVSTAA